MTNHPHRSRRSNPAANVATAIHDTPLGRWRARMQLSQRAAAAALGLSLTGYQAQERGASYAGIPRVAPMTLLLACAALERGLVAIN